MDYSATSPKALTPPDHLMEDTDDMTDFSASTAEKAKSIKANAIEKAKNIRNYAGEKASAIKHEAGEKIKKGTDKAKEFHHTAEGYIKDNPTKSVLGAMGIGVIIGLILRR